MHLKLTPGMPQMRPVLRRGLVFSQDLLVDESAAASEMPSAFSTVNLIAFVEATCAKAVGTLLTSDEQTIGSHIEINHIAPTPVGMTVTTEVELIGIDARKLMFRVLCHDDVDVVAEGFHERTIVDKAGFKGKIAAKAAWLSA